MRGKNSRPNGSWNTADLRDWIERHTQSANRAIESYMERRRSGGINPTADRNIINLQKASGQKKVGLNQRVASLSRKRKSDLLKQAEALRKFELSGKRTENWTQKTKRKKKRDPYDWENMSPEECRRTLKKLRKKLEAEGILTPKPEKQPFEDDEKKRRAYETFNRNFGGEKGIDPETFQRFIDTIGGIDFENYNVESDYIVQNIVEYLQNGVDPQRILDAWDFAFKTEKMGETTYDKVVRASMFLNEDLFEVEDGTWMSRETGEIFYY